MKSNKSLIKLILLFTLITFVHAVETPPTPTLTSPINNIQLSGTTQTLSWSDVGADKYEIYLQDSNGSWIFSDAGEKQVTETFVSYSGFKEEHTYYWNLKALNGADTYSAVSEQGIFRIVPIDSVEVFREEFITYDPKVATILTDVNINDKVSRAEAVIMVEKFLSDKSTAFKNYDMGEYYLAFEDVDTSSDYYSSLLKLSYYQGDEDPSTPISKENSLFRPIDKVSRQEFSAILVRGLDLAIVDDNSSLSDFSDFNNGTIADWAYPYLNTAVKILERNTGSVCHRRHGPDSNNKGQLEMTKIDMPNYVLFQKKQLITVLEMLLFQNTILN